MNHNVASSFTAPLRFDEPFNLKLRDFEKSLTSFPNLNFVTNSYSTWIPHHSKSSTPPTIEDIINAAFLPRFAWLVLTSPKSLNRSDA